MALEWWDRFDGSFQSKDIPRALAAMTINDNADPTLYADSGATTDIINDSGKISIIKPYKGNESIYMWVMVWEFKYFTYWSWKNQNLTWELLR